MIRAAQRACTLVVMGLLGACASAPTTRPVTRALTDCEQAFVADEKELAAAGIRDAQATRVNGFPYLRVDRLLASFNDTLATAAQRAAWLERAVSLDAQGRALEHARLAKPLTEAEDTKLAQCRGVLSRALLDDDSAWPALLAAARVPDDYSDTRRALGLYAISSRLVLSGVKRMQLRDMPRALDVMAADALRVERYGVADDGQAAAAATTPLPWPQDALGIPRIDAARMAWLWRRYAPELNIVTAGADDLPAQITAPAPPYVDGRETTLYTQLAYTRFDGQVLPQLVYTWWFAARTAQGVMDPLAGQLDGLSWRVTLDSDGEPLAYDVVHNCGCYHMFFPGERLRARASNDAQAEPPWVPFTVPTNWQGRVRLVLASGSHYVTALAPPSTTPARHRYALQSYDTLRNLADGTRRASLFDERGLVAGSARGERWFLWPMGVVAAGSMRQWGHQATAFVGRRHFDEAHLLERYFERAPAASVSTSASTSSTD